MNVFTEIHGDMISEEALPTVNVDVGESRKNAGSGKEDLDRQEASKIPESDKVRVLRHIKAGQP